MNFHLKEKYDDLPEDKQKRLFWVASIGCLLAILVVTVSYSLFFGKFDDDLMYYYNNISEFIDNHKMPYSEYTFEYPPFSLVVFLIPKLLSWDLTSFQTFYCIFAGLFGFISIYFTAKICDHFKIGRFETLVLILIILLASGKFLFERNDIFAVALILMSVYFFVNKKYVPSSILLAIATMIKIYPLVLIPIFAVIFFSKRDWKNTAIFILTAIITLSIIQLPFIIDNPDTAFAYLNYHNDRGLEVESIIASIMMAINFFVPVINGIEFSYGSYNIIGDLPNSVADVINYILIVALIAAAIWMIIRLWNVKNDEKKEFQSLVLMSVVIVMIFITFSKVYSAQYMLWIFTFVPLIIVDWKSDKRITFAFLFFTLASVICLITVVDIFLSYELHTVPTIIVIVKNIAHVTLMILYMIMFQKLTSKNNEQSIVNM